MQQSNTLATQYRPLTWKDVVGQEQNKELLRAMLVKKRVPTSIMFSGKSGCGKTTIARIFSRALVCSFPDPLRKPCNQCKECKQHLEDVSYSYTELDSASSGNVADVREISQTVYYKVSEYKVVLFDEFHLASREAQSALLKILEEAPPGIVFIFCTTDPDKVLHTIHSRSIILDFTSIDPKKLSSRLQVIADLESIKITPDALYNIAQISNGQARNAINKVEQLWLMSKDLIDNKFVEQVFGKSSDFVILKFIYTLYKGDVLEESFNYLLKSINPYNLVNEFFRVIKNLSSCFYNIDILTTPELKTIYNTLSSSLGEELFTFIKLLCDSAFTHFKSIDALYAYFLYIQHKLNYKITVNPVSHAENVQDMRKKATYNRKSIEGDFLNGQTVS